MKRNVANQWAYDHVASIVDSYNQGENPKVGLGLGSQITQLVQLLVLDKLDHYIKEELRIKHYVRYMDDFILIHHDKCYLAECRKKIDKKIRELGLLPSPKKTQLFPVVQSIKFLGFKFVLTETGKVLMLLSRDNIKKRKRKIRKDKKLVLEGRMTRETADNKYRSWRDGHAKKGNSYKMLRGMDEYYKKTWDDIEGSVA